VASGERLTDGHTRLEGAVSGARSPCSPGNLKFLGGVGGAFSLAHNLPLGRGQRPVAGTLETPPLPRKSRR